MTNNLLTRLSLLVFCLVNFSLSTVRAQTTAFTYQGRLNNNGSPANGTYDLQFSLYGAASGATDYGGTFTTTNTAVINGLFTVTLNFGNQFPGQDRWLEIGVRTNGGSGFTMLFPRQPITPAPYAINSATATSATTATTATSVDATNISGAIPLAQLPATLVTNGATGVNFSGNFSGNGLGLTNVPGTLVPQVAGGTSVTALPNTTVDVTNSSTVTVSLPTTANIGDVVQVNGTGAGGYKIDGYGTLWIPRDNLRPWRSVASSADGTKLVAVVNSGFIYTSTNSGTTWTAQNSIYGNVLYTGVASSADGTKLVAVERGDTLGGLIYTSTDSGVSWSPRLSNRFWISVASSSDGTKLVAVDNGSGTGGKIYTSTDSGVNWTSRENNRTWTSVASSADGTKLVAVAYFEQIYVSTNSGVNWTGRDSGRRWQAVASSPDGSKLIAMVDGGQIYTSTDSGATWTPRESSRNWKSAAVSSDGTKMVAVADNDQIYTSIDSGVTWKPRESSRHWQAVASSSDGTKLVAVVSGGQIYTSVESFDAGASGTSSQFQYVGNGVWQRLTPTGTFSGDGSGLTSINASNLATGTVNDARLSANVPLLNGTNVFTGTVIATNGNNQFAGNGSGLTNLNANNLASGTASDSRLSGNVALLNRSIQSFTGGTNSFSGNVGIGTTTPQSKLQVNGDVKLGSSGQYYAPAGEENLRMLRGSVTGAGAVVAGTGFTATRTANATYSVTFNTAFSSVPSVVVTCGAPGQTVSSQDSPTVTSITTTNFTLLIGVRNIGFADEPFSFIAVGPR